ncbi:MAG: T9SS type A sorting domain-containing protein, partial [Bacteroidota bacterium]
ENKPCVSIEQIMEFFELEELDFVCDTLKTDSIEISNTVLAPNPSNGVFFLLNGEEFAVKNATITISSIDGKVVYQERNVSLQKFERKYFDLSSFAENLYVLKMASDQFTFQKKIVVTR